MALPSKHYNPITGQLEYPEMKYLSGLQITVLILTPIAMVLIIAMAILSN